MENTNRKIDDACDKDRQPSQTDKINNQFPVSWLPAIDGGDINKNFNEQFPPISSSTLFNVFMDQNQLLDMQLYGFNYKEGENDNDEVNESVQNLKSDSESAHKTDIYCAICQKRCKTVHELQHHILVEHSESTQPQIPSTACPSCKYELRKINVTSYDEYSMQGANEEETVNMAPINYLMICDNCGKEYTYGPLESNPQTEPVNSNKRHFCEHCDKSYKHNRDLKKHLRTHHGIDSAPFSQTPPGEAPPVPNKMVCQQCKKMFRGPFELRRHILTVHENKRPYKCGHCNKLFRDAYELKRHSVSHQKLHFHNLGCNRIENVPNVEVRNESVHLESYNQFSSPQTTVDLYCATCEKNFRGANEFKRHYSVVHEKKYRYKCIHCGKLWRDQYDLKRHCRRSHFIDREIDRAFIRKCLLDNTNQTVDISQPTRIPLPIHPNNYDMTLTLNQEAATAIFGNNEQQNYNLEANLNSRQNMFNNCHSMTSAASMMYSNNVDAQPQNNEDLQDETKNAVNWSNFESDIQSSEKHFM